MLMTSTLVLLAICVAGGPLLLMPVLRRFGEVPVRRRRRGGSTHLPIEAIGGHLRRLSEDYARVEHANEPGKINRLRATSLAYDDVLLMACTALEVEVPERPGHVPLQPVERLTVEAELARAGLSW